MLPARRRRRGVLVGQPQRDCRPAPAVGCRRPAACPGEGSNHPGRCLRRAKHGFWGAGQPLACCRGAPGPRERVPKPQSTRLTRLELERLFFALIFAKKPQATLKNSIPSATLNSQNGFGGHRGDVRACYVSKTCLLSCVAALGASFIGAGLLVALSSAALVAALSRIQ